MSKRNRKTLISKISRKTKKKIKSFLSSKKAASVVLSTVILTAGVIAMSIAVLYWTYGMGKVSHIEYSRSTTASSNAIEERIGYEYIKYSGGILTVNLINWGKADNISIARVFVLDSSYNSLGANTTTIFLKDINDPTGSTYIPYNQLRIGKDGYFTMSTSSLHATLNPNQIYYVRIVTARGRNFDRSFMVL